MGKKDLRKLAEKSIKKKLGAWWGEYLKSPTSAWLSVEECVDAMLSFHEQASTDMFEREFVMWLFFGNHPFVKWYDLEGYFWTDEIDEKRWNLDELFSYWQKEVQK